MILYLDTSSLVKLYVEEEGSQDILAFLAEATVVATCQIAYAEARAALARKYKNSELGDEEYQAILHSLHRDWKRLFAIKVSEEVIELAGGFAERHSLRGFDAIHLASARMLRGKTRSPIVFSCADERLQDAARIEGFSIGEMR